MPAFPAQPRKPRLSVAMIARNEAEWVAATIESVRGIADEMLVLDAFSNDDTASRAKQLGAKLAYAPWCDDLSALRNRCLEQASGDWIVWTEPGERLDADSASSLRQFVDRQADSRTAYLLMIEAPPADPARGGKQSAQIRLVPNWSSLRFSGRAGENLRDAIRAANMTIGLAPGRLLRDPRCDAPEQRARRAQSLLKRIALEAAESGGYSPRLLLALGDAQADAGSPADAQQTYLRAVAASPHGSTEMLEAYFGLLRTLEGCQPRMLQISTCLNALETFPLDAQLLLAMGDYLQAHRRMDLATRSFEAAFRHGKVNLETWHLADWHAMAAACYSRALEVEGRMEEAQRVLEQAVAQHSRSPRLRRRLSEVLAKRRLVAETLADVDSTGRTARSDSHAGAALPPMVSITVSQHAPGIMPGSAQVS